jgi:hypothetical protein
MKVSKYEEKSKTLNCLYRKIKNISQESKSNVFISDNTVYSDQEIAENCAQIV